METKAILEKGIEFAWAYGPKTLAALALLFGGLWLIRRLSRGFDHFLQARKVDEGLRPFFTSLADTGMKIALILMVASTIGIATTSFIAIFSAIAFSVGLALQGSLGNFASGVLILLFRPFKVGDHLNVGGKTGRVSEIQIFSTILATPSGKKIITLEWVPTVAHCSYATQIALAMRYPSVTQQETDRPAAELQQLQDRHLHPRRSSPAGQRE